MNNSDSIPNDSLIYLNKDGVSNIPSVVDSDISCQLSPLFEFIEEWLEEDCIRLVEKNSCLEILLLGNNLLGFAFHHFRQLPLQVDRIEDNHFDRVTKQMK